MTPKRKRRPSPYIGKGITLVTVKGGIIPTKSTYETRYSLILDQDPNVVKFTYEPFKIKYKYGGRSRNYIPDFLVEYLDGSLVIVEVKPQKLVGKARNKAKIRAGKTYGINCGMSFAVITEKDLTATSGSK